MKRSVCFCNSNPAWGGGEKWHLAAALGLAQRGWNVSMLVRANSPLYEQVRRQPQIAVCPVRIGNLSFLNPALLYNLAYFFRQKAITQVILGLPADLKTAGLAAHFMRMPGIFYRRGTALPVRNSWQNRFLYGQVLTGLIVNSKETGRLALANNPHMLTSNKVHVLYNGLDTTAFDVALASATPRKHNVGDIPILGSAGRLTTQKGQHFLLYMSRALLDAGIPHKLILAGSGERLEELTSLARELNIADTLQLSGFVEDMAVFWQSIDIFILPSLWEGFGYALAEAMLAQKPVIAFDGNSMPELVHNEETGILLPMPKTGESPASVGARLAKAVHKLLTTPDLASKLAVNARNFCVQNFSQERCLDQLEAILQLEGGHA